VLDPAALNALIPDWRAKGAPLDTPVTDDQFHYLTETGSFHIPNVLLPPLMSNRGMEIASLSNLCRWLGQEAEALGAKSIPVFRRPTFCMAKTVRCTVSSLAISASPRTAITKTLTRRAWNFAALYAICRRRARLAEPASD